MTAPLPRRKGDGFAQLGIWIKTPSKNDLARAAVVEGRAQREILEEALADYFRKRPLPQPPAPKRT